MQDAIDISQATLTPLVAGRPVTATITRIDLRPDGMHIEFTKKDGPGRWAPAPIGVPGSGDNIHYTVWMGARLSDGWHLAASLNVWDGLDNFGGANRDPVDGGGFDSITNPNHIRQNVWYLDPALKSRTPVVGEGIAFMVTAGGDRGMSEHTVLERSNVVIATMPGPAGASYKFGDVVTPPDVPVDLPPVPPPADAILDAITMLHADVEAWTAGIIGQVATARADIVARLAGIQVTSSNPKPPIYDGSVSLPWVGTVKITLLPRK